MDSQTSPPPPVEYAPGDPPVRRRVRKLVVPAILLGFVVSAVWWAPPLWDRTQVWYWQRRCAAYQAAPGTIVSSKSVAPPSNGAAPADVSLVPAEWSRFYNLVSPPGFISDGTAFLHERRRPSGEAVLVAVDVVRGAVPPALEFRVRAFRPGNLVRKPLQVQDDVKFISVPAPSEYRVYGGTADPDDTAHFQFRYDFAGHTSRIDGWVRDDNVLLQETRLTTPPPPTSRG
jgi:hypothetical protein